MKYPVSSAVFAILAGALLTAAGVAGLLAGEAPDLRSSPVDAALRLGSEALAVTLLLLGGELTVVKRRAGIPILLVSLGMLLPVAAARAGRHLHGGEIGLAVASAAALGMAVVFLVPAVRRTVQMITEAPCAGAMDLLGAELERLRQSGGNGRLQPEPRRVVRSAGV